MVVYFISGLGADERLFQKLALPDNWTIKYLNWPELNDDETLESFVQKFVKLIDAKSEYALVGLSFGGMIATELAKILKPKYTIIISSISMISEMPLLYKLINMCKINKIVPAYFLNKFYPFTNYSFGAQTNDVKNLLRQVIHDTSPIFLKWAVNEILNWKNTVRPETVFHIHGTKDRIFPVGKVHADLIIQGGGHLMVYDKAEIISKVLVEKII